MRIAAIVVVFVLVVPGVADASDEVQEPPRGWYLLVGGPIAFTNTTAAPALVAVGAEASLACWACTGAPTWAGGYADIVHDFGAEQTRISVGPELGLLIFGIDGGLLAAVERDATSLGLVGRITLSAAILHLYFRGGGTFGDHGFGYIEAGLLWKAPFLLSAK